MADNNAAPIQIKKIKKMPHGAHGGAWKLAYADFVTAMMAFFLVMWIIGIDFQTKHGLAEYFQNPGAFRVDFKTSPYMLKLDGKPPSKMSKVEEAARVNFNIDYDACESLQSLITTTLRNEPRARALAPYVDIRITSEGLRIECGEIAGGTFFKPDTAELTPAGTAFFQALAPVLIGGKRKIEIEGNSDAVPLKDLKYTKWEFSADRANAVRRSFYAAGVPQDQIVSVNAKADRNLKIADNPRAVENNRIAIMIPMATK